MEERWKVHGYVSYKHRPSWVLLGFIAVSYTHLDVYKRQLYNNAHNHPRGLSRLEFQREPDPVYMHPIQYVTDYVAAWV